MVGLFVLTAVWTGGRGHGWRGRGSKQVVCGCAVICLNECPGPARCDGSAPTLSGLWCLAMTEVGYL